VSEVPKLELEYAEAKSRAIPVVAVVSLILPIIPPMGFALGTMRLFVFAGLATPFACIVAIIMLAVSRRNALLWTISILLNGIEAIYFIHVILTVWGVCP
jgi:hypothetical protein